MQGITSHWTEEINELETINYCFECLIIKLMIKTCEKLVRPRPAAKISNVGELKSSSYFEFISSLVFWHTQSELNIVSRLTAGGTSRGRPLTRPCWLWRNSKKSGCSNVMKETNCSFFKCTQHINFEQGLNKIHSLGSIQPNGWFTRRIKSSVDLIQIEISLMSVTTS